jgi:hypothetical protein
VWRIGNGKKVNSSTGKVLSSPRYLIPNATVSELFDESECGSKTYLLDKLFMEEERKLIRSIPISLTN